MAGLQDPGSGSKVKSASMHWNTVDKRKTFCFQSFDCRLRLRTRKHPPPERQSCFPEILFYILDRPGIVCRQGGFIPDHVKISGFNTCLHGPDRTAVIKRGIKSAPVAAIGKKVSSITLITDILSISIRYKIIYCWDNAGNAA